MSSSQLFWQSYDEPAGLIKLESLLEDHLMKLLKEMGVRPFICWNANGKEVIAGRRDGSVFYGTVFIHKEGQWVLKDEPDRIL